MKNQSDDAAVDALRQPSLDAAFPGQPESGGDFCQELEKLANMCDSLGVSGMNLYPKADGETHDPDVWAACLRAKVRQIRHVLQTRHVCGYAYRENNGKVDLDSIADTPDNVRIKYLQMCMGWRFAHPDRYDQGEEWSRLLTCGSVVPVRVSVVDA